MPETLEAVAIVILLVAPGFLCRMFLGAGIPRVFVSEVHFILVALLFSILVHVTALPFTLEIADRIVVFGGALSKVDPEQAVQMDWIVFLWIVCVLFVFPTLLALVLSSLWRARWTQPFLGRLGISQVESTPQAWDWFFLTQEQGCWVVAEAEDGTRVGGEYGANSFVSITPHRKDLFLETIYDVDEFHNFGGRKLDTVGAWINGEKVKSLHFYRVEEGETT